MLSGQLLFNSGQPGEPIKGEPKVIRTERRDFQGPNAGVRYLQEVVQFAPGRKRSERTLYDTDGDLHLREIYSYNPEGKLIQITTADSSGAISRTEAVHSVSSQVGERVITNKEGAEVERTLTTRDADGRVLASELTQLEEGAENKRIHLGIQYDEGGQPVETITRFERRDGSVLEYEITLRGQEEDVKVFLTDEGTSRTLLAHPGAGARRTVEHIDLIDLNGNWTKKTILEVDQATQQSRPLAEITRTITYY